MAAPKFDHEPFKCRVCRQKIGAIQQDESVGASPDEASESYTLCEGCGAVYLIAIRLREVRDIAKLSPRLTWKLIPDALTPEPVRKLQAQIRKAQKRRRRSGMFRIDRGQA